jgi:hypothetical protein
VLGEYIPEAPVDDEARKRNGNLPGMGGIYNIVNLHLYHYAGNNPLKYMDPDGNELKVIDEPFGQGYRQNSIDDNRQIVINNLSAMAGCEIRIDEHGFVSMGEIYQTGDNWDVVRLRFSQLLISDKIIGITTNTESLSGWGFNPIDSSDGSDKENWAKRNCIEAYIQISRNIFGDYKHNNPKYNVFSWLFGRENKYIYSKQTLGGATSHEVLGHATDYVTNGKFWDEYSALNGENIYHGAANELTKDVYP